MIKLRISDFDIYITFGFLFTASILILNNSLSSGFTAVSACIIHELGHCLAAIIHNVKFDSIRFWAGGIRIKSENRIVSYNTELSVLLSGPLLNLIFGVIYWFTGLHNPALINIIIAAFNLLPYSSLDGGCILKAFFEKYEKNGEFIQKIIALLFGGTVIFLMIYFQNKNYILLFAIILLILDEIL